MAYRGRGPRFVPPPQEQHRINRKIRSPEVRLIGPDGEQVGVVTVEYALVRAENAGMDLVEVAPTAKPPVCRILDYGKFQYQQHKKEAESKRKQSITTLKELRLGYKTDVGDLDSLRDDPRFNKHVTIDLGFDGGEPERHDTLILAVSTLQRLAFGMRPFWSDAPGAVRVTVMDQGCTRFARTFFPIIPSRTIATAT